MAQKNETTKAPEVRTKRRLSGVVVSAKAKDSAVVSVTRYVKHPKYKKYLKRSKKYMAHNPGNTVAEGERVTIEECRPISKRKHFQIVK